VLVTDPNELEAIRQREYDITKERIHKILDAGGQCGAVGVEGRGTGGGGAGARVLLVQQQQRPCQYSSSTGAAAVAVSRADLPVQQPCRCSRPSHQPGPMLG
jgi:hypothetical protein